MTTLLATDCPDADHFLRVAQSAALEAGRYVSSHFKGPITVDYKARSSDVVTEHDRRAEQMIRKAILAAAPASQIWGEEYGGGGEGEVVWYVDPIDGTSNFAGGLPYYCVSIGVAWRGRLLGGVIYDPERDEMFVGSAEGLRLNNRAAGSRGQPRDSDSVCLTNLPHEGMDDRLGLEALGDLLVRFRAVRRLGSSALALAYVATGRADVCCELTTKPWDHAAGAALVLAGGGGFAGLDSGGRESGDMGAVAHYVAYGAGFGFSGSVLNAILNKAPGVRSDVQ